jgi:hypothetical protein
MRSIEIRYPLSLIGYVNTVKDKKVIMRLILLRFREVNSHTLITRIAFIFSIPFIIAAKHQPFQGSTSGYIIY